MLWCWKTLTRVTCLEDGKGETEKLICGMCVREWERQLERWRYLFPQRGNIVWPKKVGLTVARGKGHWQENWFVAWSRLPDLFSRAGGIHLRAAAEKMIPVRMTGLRLYFIRCLYIILLQKGNSFSSKQYFYLSLMLACRIIESNSTLSELKDCLCQYQSAGLSRLARGGKHFCILIKAVRKKMWLWKFLGSLLSTSEKAGSSFTRERWRFVHF